MKEIRKRKSKEKNEAAHVNQPTVTSFFFFLLFSLGLIFFLAHVAEPPSCEGALVFLLSSRSRTERVTS
jgi:hypothetical protein